MEIKWNHVDFSYQKMNYSKKEVLKDINLMIPEGNITGIIGKSGSGKTTMLELMDALLFPTNGSIQMGKFMIQQKKTKDMNNLHFEVGLVFQFPEDQIFNSTVKEELEFSLKLFHYKEEQSDKRVRDALKMVDLSEEYLNRNPLHLSSGEKRKIALASILILNPKVLLLDEPTIGLDKEAKKSFLRLIRLLKNRYHKTIVIVSHDTNLLHQIVDYVFVLDQKKIVLEGDKYTVFKEVKKLKQYEIMPPKIMEFSNKVLQKKKIRIGYRDEINDLIKDIYRYVK